MSPGPALAQPSLPICVPSPSPAASRAASSDHPDFRSMAGGGVAKTEEQAAGPLYIEISRYLETIYTGTGVMARVMHGDIIYSMFLE